MNKSYSMSVTDAIAKEMARRSDVIQMKRSDVTIGMVDEIAKELDCTSDVILENIVNFAWESIFGTMLERCQPGREEMADFLNCLPKRW